MFLDHYIFSLNFYQYRWKGGEKRIMCGSSVRSFARSVGSEKGIRETVIKTLSLFPSILRIIKPIYNNVPFPSTFQKSKSGVF